MSWANSVLPTFTGDSSEKLRITPDQVQIDTTHFRLQALAKPALFGMRFAVNRTAVIEYKKFKADVERSPESARKRKLQSRIRNYENPWSRKFEEGRRRLKKAKSDINRAIGSMRRFAKTDGLPLADRYYPEFREQYEQALSPLEQILSAIPDHRLFDAAMQQGWRRDAPNLALHLLAGILKTHAHANLSKRHVGFVQRVFRIAGSEFSRGT